MVGASPSDSTGGASVGAHHLGDDPPDFGSPSDADAADNASAAEFAADDVDASDYYAQLGVFHDATADELRKAYLRQVKLWHPDRFANAPVAQRARAENRMRRLNEAYDTLGDQQARATYDRLLSGYGVPVGDVINVFGQSGAAVVADAEDAAPGRFRTNPHGAGQFFGMLALIVALALIGGALNGGGAGGVYIVTAIGLGAAVLVVAALLFTSNSPLAQWATRFMEAEPRGSRATFAHASGARQSRPDQSDAEAGLTDAERFESLIDEALTAVPHQFDAYLRNVVVLAEDEPDAETLQRAGVPPGHTLLGLYKGVPLSRSGAAGAGPEVITIYRGPIERYCGGDLPRIRAQVRATVLHELAHHFGIDHDEMPEWVK